MIGTFNYEEAIQIATAIEERGYRIYTECARKVRDEFASNILIFLANQEKNHKEIFENLRTKISKTDQFVEELDEETATYLNALAKSYVFPEDENTFMKSIKSIDDVLTTSMQAEKNSILLYSELARITKNLDSKRIFEQLTSEEKSHLVKLQELSKLIDERGIYY